MARITLEDIINLGDEDIRKLNRQQLLRRVNIANSIANKRRNEALQYLEENPETPTPLVYKKYTKTVKPKHGAIDWRNYEFNIEKGESVNILRNKLANVRDFLSRKTSSIEGWLDSIKDFTLELGKKAGIDIKLDELSGIKYKRLWRVYNRLTDMDANVGTEYQDSKQLQALIYQAMTDKSFSTENTTSMGVDRLTEYLERFLSPENMSKNLTDEEQDLLETVYGGLGRQG